MAYSEAVAERIRKVLGQRAGLTERKMFGGLGFLVRGKVVIGVMGDKVLTRVVQADHAKTVKPPHIKPMVMGGRESRGWLFVTGPSVASPAGLRKWIAAGERAIAETRRT